MNYKKEIIKILEEEAVLLDEGFGTTGITEYEHELVAERIMKLFNVSEVNNIAYFLCSKSVVDFDKPTEISKPFKSGYSYDKDDEYFIAVINFEKCENYYHQLSDDERDDFWFQELVPGTMDVSKITLKGMKKNCIFLEIEKIIGLTTIKNRTMTLYNLSEKFNVNPIELINKIAD